MYRIADSFRQLKTYFCMLTRGYNVIVCKVAVFDAGHHHACKFLQKKKKKEKKKKDFDRSTAVNVVFSLSTRS